MFDIFTRRRDIVIDLGTANTIVYIKPHGVVFNEPSCVAIERNRGVDKVVAIGAKAKAMRGKTPQGLEVVYPLNNGAISDFEMTKAFMGTLIASLLGKMMLKPRVGISIPQNLTPVERSSLYEAALLAGAKEVVLIEDPFSAAVGAGIDISSSRGRMIVDIGSGLTEVSIIALGGLVASKSSKIAGDALDLAIVEYIKHYKNLSISKDMAEDIKIKLANIENPSHDERIVAKAKDLIHGLPVSFEISSHEISAAIAPNIEKIVKTVTETVSVTPPQIAPDILEDGIVLTGGGALLKGLKGYLSRELQLNVNLSPDPLTDISKGARDILQMMGRIPPLG
ncbi:MAG: rod shape-determining protein [Wolinella sp.]